MVKETIRVRPVIPDVARYAAAPIELGGYALPAGVTVMPAIALVRWGEDFPDADEFRPERFLDTEPPAFAWIPFGGGRRRCLGAAFASFEMHTVLQRVLTQVHLTAPDPRDEAIKPAHITLIPNRGARMTVTAA